jgi:hypothetical protein
VSRQEFEVFGLAMLGGGRVSGTAHLFDYPWARLGRARVVDVGGGVGTSSTIVKRDHLVKMNVNFETGGCTPI